MLALKAWLEQQLARVSAKATIPEDIRYALNHWDGLTRSGDHGHIELDSNIIERSTRPLFSIKNVLFAGHNQEAENWACVASFIETCKLNCVDRQAYCTGVLTKLVNLWPASRIDELMPWTWAPDTRQTVKRRDAKLRIDKVIKSSKPCGQKTAFSKATLAGPLKNHQRHITLTIAQVHEPRYWVGGNRSKIERALKNQSKGIFGRTSRKSSFGSKFLP